MFGCNWSFLWSFRDVDPLDDEVGGDGVLGCVPENSSASRSGDHVWLAVCGDERDRVPLQAALWVVDPGG